MSGVVNVGVVNVAQSCSAPGELDCLAPAQTIRKKNKKLLTLLKFSNLEERETLDCSIQVAQQPDRICDMCNGEYSNF